MTVDPVGLYPAFTLLGIFDHCSPLLLSEVALFSAMLSSFDETSKTFHDRGVNLHINTIRRIAERFAKRAAMAQQVGELSCSETLDGRTVVVSTDGGRVRIRKDKRGPRTQKGRRRYSTHWREPKLLIIYTVDENGKMDRSFAPFIEGTLKGPDAVFGLIHFHLAQLSVHLAEQIVFVADGARWIWNRVSELFQKLRIAPEKVFELIDFYHAVEHLNKFAKLKKGWKASERRRWVKKCRRLLFNSGVDEVIKEIKALCQGRHSKKLATEKEYFVRNKHRMHYQVLKEQNLPIGSGAIESAVRRVVNLRLKGASIYWLEATAEAMLLLRSYYKAGRWNTLKELVFSSNVTNKV